MSKNQIFEIEVGNFGAVQKIPAYSCGHCSATVILRPDRTRERLSCKKCGRWLCEQNAICHSDCTPLYEIVDDRSWLQANKWTRLLPAIMGGATTVEEAASRGLLKE